MYSKYDASRQSRAHKTERIALGVKCDDRSPAGNHVEYPGAACAFDGCCAPHRCARRAARRGVASRGVPEERQTDEEQCDRRESRSAAESLRRARCSRKAGGQEQRHPKDWT